ncbi:MAG: GGDEF domain-containing protein [Byssovorax sp.]
MSRPDDEMECTKVANLKELQAELAGRSQRYPHLLVLTGANIGQTYRLEDGETFLGRGQNATIRLSDDGISRRHARLVQVGGQVIIEDLKSSNGTLVNGQVITEQTLADGDKIRLGSTTILKFTYHDRLEESFQQQLYDAALRDALTKAFNRKYFLDQLDVEIAYARRHRANLSLVMVDVDHFKRINDTYGHLAGDFVLTRLAKLASTTVRTEDIFARYGGEEFCVICRGVSLPSAGTLGERLRVAVESTVFEHEGMTIPVTISVGVAAHPDLPVENSAQLIAGADEALYEAKRGGRNRVLLKQGPGG